MRLRDMNQTTKTKLNRILIPKKLCHAFNLHRWFYSKRNHALISAKCVRCGMNGIEYKNLLDKK